MTISNQLFEKAYKGSWYTITGCGGDIEEWKKGYTDILEQRGIGTIKEFHTFTGKEYNDEFGLTGNNRYPDDLTFLTFPLDGLNIGKLAPLKLMMEDRWFDDIVSNDLRREGIDYEN